MNYKVVKQRTTSLAGLREEYDLDSFDSKDSLLDYIKNYIQDESKEVFDRTKAIFANDEEAKQGIFLQSVDKNNGSVHYYYYIFFTPDKAENEYLITSLNNYALYNELRSFVNDELKKKDSK